MSNDPVEALYERAKQHGIAMSRICGRAGIFESTPSRWRSKKNGASWEKLKALNEALDGLIAEEVPRDVLAINAMGEAHGGPVTP